MSFAVIIEKDGLSVEISVSSINLVFKETDSYLSVSVPDADLHYYVYENFQGGEILLTQDSAEFIRLNISDIQLYYGSKSNSVMIEGRKKTYTPVVDSYLIPDSRVTNVKSRGNNKFYTVLGDSFIYKPGDSVTTQGETFTVNAVTYSFQNTKYSIVIERVV